MNIRWLALPAALLCFQVAVAAQNSPEAPEQTPLPQVDIEAERAKLHAMEAQLYAFEDEFFARYNELNDNFAYKVHCGWEMRRQFRVHQCRPVFQEWAQRAGGFEHIGSTGIIVGDPNGEPSVVRLRTRDYQKHMVALVSKHPELLKVLQERAELAQRYAVLRKKFIWD